MQELDEDARRILREPDDDARLILRLIVEQPTVHFTVDELSREAAWPPVRVEDALAELSRPGLIHRIDGFVFASRTAVRCHELLA